MIACISIPFFAAAVERRADDALVKKPLAIGGQPWEARPIYAFSKEVATMGVKIGMSLRLVQVLSPDSYFMPAAETQYSQTSGEVIDVLIDFSSLIEPQELWHPFADREQFLTLNSFALPARYCLDLEGLPKQEAVPFVQEIGKRVRAETTLEPTIGLAAHKFTAEVAASVCRTNHAIAVTPGEESPFLASRPLSFLPLEKDMARRLRLLGIQTLGQFASLSLTALREQFGPEIVSFHCLAQGKSGELVQPREAVRIEEVRYEFDDPVGDLQVITAVCRRLSVELSHRLQGAEIQGRRLRLEMELENGEIWQQGIVLRRPVFDQRQINRVTNELLAKKNIPHPASNVKLVVSDLSPAAAQQLTLFGQSAVSHQAQQTLLNLVRKYRSDKFYQPQPVDRDHPLPERRFHLQPISYDPLMV
ncbi:MAG: hypothetical protein R3293_15095 [Candidatus Promineifilaceae bacterium]|nr:hypothetical protein [Candidatus Promineifilaceae bacterium]